MHVSIRPFEYVHLDLWGLSKVKTLRGGSYFLIMIDDFSRIAWIYIFKDTTIMFQKLKE